MGDCAGGVLSALHLRVGIPSRVPHIRRLGRIGCHDDPDFLASAFGAAKLWNDVIMHRRRIRPEAIPELFQIEALGMVACAVVQYAVSIMQSSMRLWNVLPDMRRR